MRELSKGERRFLANYECGFCEHPMHRDGCGAIWEKCSADDQERRRASCLKHYKPRPRLKRGKLEGVTLV